jgi:hypothetical protein
MDGVSPIECMPKDILKPVSVFPDMMFAQLFPASCVVYTQDQYVKVAILYVCTYSFISLHSCACFEICTYVMLTNVSC